MSAITTNDFNLSVELDPNATGINTKPNPNTITESTVFGKKWSIFSAAAPYLLTAGALIATSGYAAGAAYTAGYTMLGIASNIVSFIGGYNFSLIASIGAFSKDGADFKHKLIPSLKAGAVVYEVDDQIRTSSLSRYSSIANGIFFTALPMVITASSLGHVALACSLLVPGAIAGIAFILLNNELITKESPILANKPL